ncbi:hypothetical protein MBSD_n0313 [Mizugakiibacter sediminis]|uniref:Glycosyl transferase group 1 n=1 Tax=Mizugakiibacter sediminis TaxID=1475481 RepID=A0A0K8QJB2_9GAMM|nr:glycosyltransferase family 1 protein [Mizugakiibacter sediminis]GAP65025.1 hypothetical protein MBSD_n0313 [Mizugakiibacter sediminis]
MRVGVDARCLTGQLTGIGRYVRETLWELYGMRPGWEWFLYSRTPVHLPLPSGRWHSSAEPNPLYRRMPGLLWVKARLGELAIRDGIDVFWAAGTLLPTLNCPSVTTVYDLNHLLVPETMPIVNRFAYKRWFASDVLRADEVVAISRGTASRLHRHIGRTTDLIATPGARWSSVEGASISERPFAEPYLFCAATREPRKNLVSLVRAVASLKARGEIPGHLLVIAGARGWGAGFPDFEGKPPGWLRELGYVADEAMAALFAHADALVQPSIYEGFGLPAAEAAAFGTRVVATDIPELREAAGSTGIFVQPDVEGIAEGILKALAGPRPKPVSTFTWHGTASVMLEAFESAVSRASRA